MAREKIKGKALYEKETMLATYEGRDRIISSHELAEELKKTDDAVFKIPTGVTSLDRILGGGVEAGELIVVTGPTGEGKTTLLMTVTKNMITSGVQSVWFTLEVTPRQFLKKLMKADDVSVPLFYIPRSGIEDSDDDYVKAWEQRRKKKYEMIDWIEDRIIEAKVKVEKGDQKLKAVFIDHIHMIFSLSRMSNNISLEIGDLVQKIKDMALIHGIAIFVIAHCKDPEQGASREPRKEDIRDSGMISRTADSIIGVWRIANSNDGMKTRRDEINEHDNKAKVRVFKNRREGTQGSFTMYHVDHYLSEEALFGDDGIDEYWQK